MTAINEMLQQPFGQAIGWALLQFVWQGTLIALLTAALLAALRRSGPDVRYVVATIALALMLTIVILLRHPRGTRDPLRIAWMRFVDRLRASGLPKSPSEGSQAFGARAAHAFPEVSEQILSLSQRYARRRYAAVVIDPVLDAALCDDLRRFRVPHATQRNNRRSA